MTFKCHCLPRPCPCWSDQCCLSMVLNFSFTNQPLMRESNPFWRCGRWFIRWKLQGCPWSPRKYALKHLCISLGTEISFGHLSDQYIRPAKDLAAKIRGNVLYLCHNDQPRHSRSMHMTSKVTIHCTQTTKGNLWHRERWPGRENLISYQGIVTLDRLITRCNIQHCWRIRDQCMTSMDGRD